MGIKKIDVDFFHTDERGTICQVLSIPNSQVNYLFTKKGAKRGKHYHKENREVFYIIKGAIRLETYSANDIETEHEEFLFKTGDLFSVEPFTVHDFEFVDDTHMIVVYDKGVEHSDGSKDIYM